MTRESAAQPTGLACCTLPAIERRDGVVKLRPAELERMREHARSSYPAECCGVLTGLRGGETAIRGVHPTENRRHTRRHDRYQVDPREILRLDRAAESRGEEIVGFYHSHPDHPAAPSATDAEHAWPGYVYLILSVQRGKPTRITAWSYDEERHAFREWRLRSRETLRHKLGRVYEVLTTFWRYLRGCQSE
jgi:proteasome lid subunit RPN8/RPN11